MILPVMMTRIEWELLDHLAGRCQNPYIRSVAVRLLEDGELSNGHKPVAFLSTAAMSGWLRLSDDELYRLVEAAFRRRLGADWVDCRPGDPVQQRCQGIHVRDRDMLILSACHGLWKGNHRQTLAAIGLFSMHADLLYRVLPDNPSHRYFQ
jgi:hypothetical protein